MREIFRSELRSSWAMPWRKIELKLVPVNLLNIQSYRNISICITWLVYQYHTSTKPNIIFSTAFMGDENPDFGNTVEGDGKF